MKVARYLKTVGVIEIISTIIYLMFFIIESIIIHRNFFEFIICFAAIAFFAPALGILFYVVGGLVADNNSQASDNEILKEKEQTKLSFKLLDNEESYYVDKGADTSQVFIPKFYKNKLVTSIAGSSFYGRDSIVQITLPDSIKSIEKFSFARCSSLININLPNSVINIGEFAFSNCISLETIDIPTSITIIDAGMFKGCSSLSIITIPDSVIEISDRAFEECISLKTVYYKGTEEQWNAISVKSSNSCLTNATIIYNYKEEN